MKRHQGLAEPLIGSYMPGKKVSANWAAANLSRQLCLGAIQSNPAADATVIGVHVPGTDDDPVLNEVLTKVGQLRGRRHFVNPNPCEIATAQLLGFTGKVLEFDAYIEQLREMRRRNPVD